MRDYKRYRFGHKLDAMEINLVQYTKITDSEKVNAFYELQRLAKEQKDKLGAVAKWILTINSGVEELEEIIGVKTFRSCDHV